MRRLHCQSDRGFSGLYVVLTGALLILGCSGSVPAYAQSVVPFGTPLTAPLPGCVIYASGASTHLVCVPQDWNGSLIVYAHGYVSPELQTIPTLPSEAAQVQQLVAPLGFAFATTSYPDVGLVVPGAVTDLVSLVSEFESQYPSTRNVYLIGFSEGGLISTKAVEQHADVFSGGLACCGPVGDFRKQIDYIGDFFVVFNYFFPGVFPAGTGPGGVPQQVIDHWQDVYVPLVESAISANPGKLSQLLRVTHAAVDPADPATAAQTVFSVLWYDIFATNDALNKLGGQPFDNSLRWYTGSTNDRALNRGVQRFHADTAALGNIQKYYQTTGILKRPLVTMHTIADPVIPYWHELIYNWKTLINGSFLLHTNIPIIRYGHCAFTTDELLKGFGLLVLKATGQNLFAP